MERCTTPHPTRSAGGALPSRRNRAWRLGAVLGALLVALTGCRDDRQPPIRAADLEGALRADAEQAQAESTQPTFPEVSVDAKLDTFESLMLDLSAERHASDGGGRAWIERVEVATRSGEFTEVPRSEAGEPRVGAGSRARFHLVYEAGPMGISVGGFLFLQAPPFWEWATPQADWPDGVGYTTVTTSASGIVLEPSTATDLLLAIEISGRGLATGERIEIVYGAGPGGTSIDRYAERESRLFLAVDGDGDGVRKLIADSPSVEILAERPAQLILTLPTTAEPGDEIRLTAALLDYVGNAGVDFTGEILLTDSPEGLDLPDRIQFEPEHRGRRTVGGRVRKPGIFRIKGRPAERAEIREAESNPLVVRDGITPVLWGDLHGHSNLSDGTGTPEDFYEYARDVAALDIVSLTDHDHWGMRFIDETPEVWARIRAAAAAYHEPGRFVTLLGYEWTSWLQGHRHVLYFDDPDNDPDNEAHEILSSMDPRYQTPAELWAALEGQPVLTFAHHSAGGPISTNWSFIPPPEIEPVTEIASVHGSSEAPDSPSSIYRPVRGNFVRDILALGVRFGFIGSGDSHDGHPGLATLASGTGLGGLAAISAEARTRDAVLAALRARKTYATNGTRIYLDVRLEDEILAYAVAATNEISRIDFIRSGLTASIEGDGQRDIQGTREIPPLRDDEYVYLRVVQTDGSAAWSSPIYGAPAPVPPASAP